MYTLHSDEVVSLISGDESVVYSCSPIAMDVTFYCHSGHYYYYELKPLIYIDIYPRISLVSVLKNG